MSFGVGGLKSGGSVLGLEPRLKQKGQPDSRPRIMKREPVAVQIRKVLPVNSGCAIFLGTKEKVFVIQVEHTMGNVIGKFLRDAPKERPMTHDLIGSLLAGFGITLERVVINELRDSTYYARVILKQANELGRKLVELDARPSDSLALALAHKRPVYVAPELWDEVQDMSSALEEIGNAGDPSDEDET